MVLNSVRWRCFHVSLLIGYRCQTIWDYFKSNFPTVKIQTVTPEADVGPFSPLRNVVWHPSRWSLWGKKRKLYLILACLVSSFQNLHVCAIKNPHPFSLCLHRDRVSCCKQMEYRQVGTWTLFHLHTITTWPKIWHKMVSSPFCPLIPVCVSCFSSALVGSNSQETEVTRTAPKPLV